MKFAVCDEEREMADLVAEKLREFYPDECEIKCYTDGKILLEDSARKLFDAFFLDIGMPRLDGFALAEKIRSDNLFAKIIFVTKNTELAHIGYLYVAFRYVRKFALEEELREAAQSLKHEFDLQSEFLLLKTPLGEVVRAVNSIKYFEVKGHNVTAFFDDTEERVSGTLNEYEERLKCNGFIRIHKSFLVNFRFTESIGKNTVTLTDGSTLALSRNKVAETKRKMLIFRGIKCCCAIGCEIAGLEIAKGAIYAAIAVAEAALTVAQAAVKFAGTLGEGVLKLVNGVIDSVTLLFFIRKLEAVLSADVNELYMRLGIEFVALGKEYSYSWSVKKKIMGSTKQGRAALSHAMINKMEPDVSNLENGVVSGARLMNKMVKFYKTLLRILLKRMKLLHVAKSLDILRNDGLKSE